MDLEFIAGAWDSLKHHIDSTELTDAANTLVSYLIDHNFGASEINDAFEGDREIKKAVTFFEDQFGDSESYEEYDDEDGDDEDEDY